MRDVVSCLMEHWERSTIQDQYEHERVSFSPIWMYVVAPYGRLLCAMLVSWQRVCVPQARRQSPLSWDPLRLGRRQMALPITVTLGRGRWDLQPRVKWSEQTCVITQDEQHWLVPGPAFDLTYESSVQYIYYIFELGCYLHYNQSLTFSLLNT